MAAVPENEIGPEVEAWTQPPFLRRVRIRGYKSIAFCDVTLEPLTILVGRNAAGKSNFLDALAFLRDCVTLDVAEAVQRRGNMEALLCRSAGASALTFEIETRFTAGTSLTEHQAHYRLHIPADSSAGVLTYGEPEEEVFIKELPAGWEGSITCQGPAPKELREFVGPTEEGVPRTPADTIPLSIASGQLMFHYLGHSPYVEFADSLRRMTFYNFIPEAIRPLQRPNPGQMLEQNGRNLARVLADTQRHDAWAFQRVNSYLSAVVPEIERFGVVSYGDYETIQFRLGCNGADKKREFDAFRMSDGTLRVLATLTAAFQRVLRWGCPSVVGIEEPETALHPAAMRALVDALDEATMRTQILLTTHSADMLDNPTIRPENVRVVEMIEGQTTIGPLDEASIEIVRRKLNTLGGLERENQLEPDLDDRQRQRQLAQTQGSTP